MSVHTSDRVTNMPNNVSNLITRAEAAKMAGKSVSTIRSWIRAGLISKHVKTANKKNATVYVDMLELQNFLVVHGKKPTPDMSTALVCQSSKTPVSDTLHETISELEQKLRESQNTEKELRVRIQIMETDRQLSDRQKEQELTDLRQDKAFLRGQIEKKDEQIERIEAKLDKMDEYLRSKWWLRMFVAGQLPGPTPEKE